MIEAWNIISAIFDSKLTAYLVYSGLMVCCAICKLQADDCFPYFKHRRNWLSVVLFIVYLLGFGGILFFSHAPLGVVLVLAALLAVYAYAIVASLKAPILFSKWYILTYRKRLHDGMAMEAFAKVDKKPWFLLDAVEIIQWKRLKADFLCSLGRHYAAYKLLCTIQNRDLYETEARDLAIAKAFILYHMGAYTKAAHLLDTVCDKNHPAVWELKSILAENDGDILEASRCMEMAKLHLPDDDLEATYVCKIRVFCNLGRILQIRNNLTEAIHYYQLAAEVAKKAKYQDALHVPVYNLIMLQLLSGEISADVSLEMFQKYENCITCRSISNMIEISNAETELYRQIQDIDREFETIRVSYKAITMAMDALGDMKVEKSLLQAGTFRELANRNFTIAWLEPDIRDAMDSYFDLPLPEKMQVLKEFHGVITNTVLRDQEPYASLLSRITAYYNTNALAEISEYMEKMDELQVHAYFLMSRHRLYIQKAIAPETYLPDTLIQQDHLIQRMLETGHKLDAMDALLGIVDECIAPNNQYKLDAGGNLTDISLAAFEATRRIASLPEAIDTKSIRFESTYRELMSEKLREAIGIWKTIPNHPVAISTSIAISFFLFALGRVDEAREYYMVFENSGISINHFAHWYQVFYQVLHTAFDIDPDAQTKESMMTVLSEAINRVYCYYISDERDPDEWHFLPIPEAQTGLLEQLRPKMKDTQYLILHEMLSLLQAAYTGSREKYGWEYAKDFVERYFEKAFCEYHAAMDPLPWQALLNKTAMEGLGALSTTNVAMEYHSIRYNDKAGISFVVDGKHVLVNDREGQLLCNVVYDEDGGFSGWKKTDDYSGEYRNSLRHGDGIAYSPTITRHKEILCKGQWKDGNFIAGEIYNVILHQSDETASDYTYISLSDDEILQLGSKYMRAYVCENDTVRCEQYMLGNMTLQNGTLHVIDASVHPLCSRNGGSIHVFDEAYWGSYYPCIKEDKYE